MIIYGHKHAQYLIFHRTHVRQVSNSHSFCVLWETWIFWNFYEENRLLAALECWNNLPLIIVHQHLACLDTPHMMLDTFQLIHWKSQRQTTLFLFHQCRSCVSKNSIQWETESMSGCCQLVLKNPPLVHQQAKCLFYFDPKLRQIEMKNIIFFPFLVTTCIWNQ